MSAGEQQRDWALRGQAEGTGCGANALRPFVPPRGAMEAEVGEASRRRPMELGWRLLLRAKHC